MTATRTDVEETGFQMGLREILLEIVAPVLIMFMLGSLFFYFLEIFYRGEHRLPIHWIFGLYVFAIVLVCRISIMEGLERARFFAIALILAVTIHTRLGMHLILVLATWWAANKLTWDCTFIDESRDVSGQGLVSAAWDQWRAFWRGLRQVWLGEKSLADWMEPERPPEQSGPMSVQSWMKQILWKQKRKNTPGIWAFYFFVVGLILFAAGQLFVEPSARARSYSLWMFSIYAFSGLGLMLFISLIGLMRYLRQRGVTMPDSIARVWLAVGLAFAIAVVGTMYLLPWPNSGLSLSGLVPRFQTAQRTGERSPLTERGRADSGTGNARTDPRGAPGQGTTPTEKEGAGGTPGGSKQGQQAVGNPGNTSGGTVGGGKGPKPASQANQDNSAPPANQQAQPSRAPQQPPGNNSANQAQKSDGAPKNDSSKSQSNSAQTNRESPSNQGSQPKPSNAGSTPQSQPGQRQTSTPDRTPSTPPQNSPQQPEPGQRSQPSQGSASQATEPKPQTPQPQTADSNNSNWFASLWRMLSSIISVILWFAAVIVAVFFAIRYRNEIVAGLTAFFRALSEWLAQLFGNKTSKESTAGPASAAAPLTETKPFNTYRNPFADDSFQRRAPAELVEYTFAALEALSRDARMGRQLDETPLEFSARLAALQPTLRDARQLAQLYSQAAYAPVSLTMDVVAPLREFWTRMQRFAQTSTPASTVAPVR